MGIQGLDVRNREGAISRIALAGTNMVIGRTPEAQIFLDSRTISRKHAEMICDPFGRWWVRDLGSHNGTVVNGNRVTEHLLKVGDQIQVGEFTLSLASTEEIKLSDSASTIHLPVSEGASGRITGLRDVESPRLAAAHLSILSDFGQQLLGMESAAERLNALCALMVRREFHGRSAVALRASKESFTEAPKSLCAPQSAPGDQTLAPYVSRTLLRSMLARNEAVIASNTSMGSQGQQAAPVAELSIASDVMSISAVACPITSEKSYTDLLYVLFPPEYGNSEWLALTTLAVKQFQQAESTWAARRLGEDHAAIERELTRAHAIQKRLVPRDVNIPNLDYSIGFVPCRWVGGDYVDVVKGGKGHILLTIADVCGKGLPAALVASSLHMLTHTAMRTGTPLPMIMQNLNVYLADTLSDGTFVTMIAALLDPEAGTLELINCGHPPGFFISPKGELEMTQAGVNMPLGLEPTADLESMTTSLDPGTYLALYTDGLSELPLENGELLGEDALGVHLTELVKKCEAPPASADLSAKLTELLDKLQTGMSRDDRTFLIARRV